MMIFCQKCGAQLQDGINACPNCGTFITGTPHNINNGTNNGMNNTTYYVKPRIPGRGLGISGMVLSIIGLVFGFIFLTTTIDVINDPFLRFDDDFISVFIVYSVLSILGLSLSGTGRSKGYRNGISLSGIIMGIVGIVLFLISIILYASY